MNSEPMTKADGFSLIAYSLVIAINVRLALSSIFSDHKEVALRNLIEDRLKENEK